MANQYSFGETIFNHRGVKVNSILHVEEVDNIIQNSEDFFEYDVGTVPLGYEHRPELISHIFYGTPSNWWLLMLVNGITDPNEGFRVRQKIKIPKLK